MTLPENPREHWDCEFRQSPLENFEKSDWGLLYQAVEHYSKNRRRGARKRAGVENALEGVWLRFEALERAFRWLQRGAPSDTDEPVGGRIAVRFGADDG